MKALLLLLAPALLVAQSAKDTCIECHSAMEGDIQRPALLIKDDIHTANGLSCADCHGGDRTSDDPSVAMSKAKGFLGKPARTAIPEFCAKCHSNPDYMRHYRPQQRVDQLALYKTSVHGQLLAKGDENVATCVDCHSVHNIHAVKDAMAPVYPLHIPDTCGRCHSDAKKMAKYGIPTDEADQYRTSVHWAALSKGGDLSAPTCVSCHGNHGAKPPEVESVAAVCGTCHVLFQQLYEKSPHEPVFSGVGGGGGCIVCHSNHGIHQPSTAMLAGPKAVCSQCHDPSTPGANAAVQIAGWVNTLDASLQDSETVLGTAERAGMEVSDAQAQLADGREDLIKARLAMHSFHPEEMHQPIEAGMSIAGETLRAGQAALKERDFRRFGLAISVLFIIITVVALFLVIRRLEANGEGYLEAPPQH
ncbi:MAG TPA: cytochrome c3 family protein [Bryobacteraceae bacterium]|nr:cytochrome c3 family protein [Bryobacteraceae bacterium]